MWKVTTHMSSVQSARIIQLAAVEQFFNNQNLASTENCNIKAKRIGSQCKLLLAYLYHSLLIVLMDNHYDNLNLLNH